MEVRRTPFEIERDDGDEVLIRPLHREEPTRVDAWSVDLLERLRGFQSIDAHTAELSAELGIDDTADLPEQLGGLVDAGLLIDRDGIERIVAEQNARPTDPLELLVISTCARPEIAARCMRSFIAHGGAKRILITDDSNDADRAALLAAVRSLDSAGLDVRYAGTPQKRAYVQRLGQVFGGELDRTIELGLLGPKECGRTVGANRNTAFLAAAGQRFVSVDDDTLAPLATIGSGGSGATKEAGLTRYANPTAVAVYHDVSAALAAVVDAEACAIDAHESVLGHGLAAIIHRRGTPGWMDELSDSLLGDVLTGRGRVAATMTGVVGDVGMSTTHSYLFLEGDSRRRLAEGDYEQLRLSRGMVRSVDRLTLGRPGFFMTPCAGYDHRQPLPPMFPFDRFQDHLFAACLRAADPHAYAGVLPELVRHRPTEKPRALVDSLYSPTLGVHTALHVMMAVSALEETDGGLVSLGGHLHRVGSLPRAEYRDFIEDLHRRAVRHRIRFCRRLLERHNEHPDVWAKDVRICAERWQALLDASEPSVPRDLLDQGLSASQAWRTAQAALAGFGRLTLHWARLFSAAHVLERDGVGLGDTMGG